MNRTAEDKIEQQAVMDSQYGWAALLRRTRHIGDFTDWTDDDKYNTAFERLLKDLRAGR